MNNEILFSETQKFRQWWLWVILIGINALLLYGVYQQVLKGQTFGSKPASNTELLVITGITLLLTIFILFIRLDTYIKEDGVYVKFFPLHVKARHYSWPQLSKCYVRKYSPIREFGGWGLRIGLFGKAYNISGNQGLQLEFADDRKLLIGTQKSKQLTEALIRVGHYNS